MQKEQTKIALSCHFDPTFKKTKQKTKKKTDARITERVFGEDITKDAKWKSVHVSLYTYINFDSDVFLFTSSCDEW